MMRRDECLKMLARHHTDEIVVPVYQAAFEWRTIKPQSLIYLGVGAMGQASSHALGLALGRPDKRVIVLDGDSCEVCGVGFAGVKGFCGGFGRGALGAWGEPAKRSAVAGSSAVPAARADQPAATCSW